MVDNIFMVIVCMANGYWKYIGFHRLMILITNYGICAGPAKTFCFYFQLDLRCAAIDEQLDACDEIRFIGCQKERSGCNFARLAHSTHWDYGDEAVLHSLWSTLKYGSIYRTWTNDICERSSYVGRNRYSR